MGHFSKRLITSMSERHITAAELSRKLGVNEGTISNYKNGKYEPKQRRLDEISQILNVSIPWLMGADVPMDRQDDFIDIFSISNIIQLPKMKEVPLLGTIACGTPILADGNIQEYLKVPFDKNVDFALECQGDSMINARIYDGDIVFIKLQSDVNDGEIAAVLIDEEATLKKVYKYPSKIVLRACNPTFDDMIYTNEELNQISIIGKAVMFMSNVR